MASPLRLHPNQVADLKTICSIDVESLQRLVTTLQKLSPPPLQLKQLRLEITRVVTDQEPATDALLRQLMGLYELIGQLGISADEVIKRARAGIEAAQPPWGEDEISAWSQRESALKELISTSAVRVVAKTLDLSYEYANVLQTARIITDVRPVFTSDATGIDGAVISHKLFIRFYNVEGQKTFTMTLDEGDVKGLRAQCERALQKATTIEAQLDKATRIRTVVPGRESDG